MKKKLLQLLFLLVLTGAYGQVGIGTSMPDSSSQLDVVAENRGILIPRLKLTSTTDISTISKGNVNSLLVFNTATVADVTPGYYYWFVDRWNRISISSDIGSSQSNVIFNPLTKNISYIDNGGNVQVIDFQKIVQSYEIVTTLVRNSDGTYIYTNEAGTVVTIDANTTTVTVANGVYTFTDAAGATITTIDTKASASDYNNATSGLAATNVQSAIDELTSTIKTNKGDLTVAGGLEFTGGTVGTAKLLANAGIQVANSGITSTQLANDAVTTDKIANGAITNAKVDADAITSDKIKDGEVKTADLDNKAVTADKLGSGAATSGQVTTANGDGTVSYKTLTVAASDLTNKKTLTGVGITINSPAGDGVDALLKDVVLGIADNAITAAKLTAGAGNPNRIAIADAAGNVTYSNTIPGASVAGADVTAASNRVTLGGTPLGAALKPFSIDVDQTKLSLNANQIIGGTAGQIMVVNSVGINQWVNKDATTNTLTLGTDNKLTSTVNGVVGEVNLDGVITADNGLTKTDKKIQLGGALLKTTEIAIGKGTGTPDNPEFTLAVKGLPKGLSTQDNNMVVVDAVTGVLKQMKAAPKFFYMPSIVMPTANDQFVKDDGSGFSESGGVFKVNLHDRYSTQFGTPKKSNAGKTTSLPVLDANELDYHITWYDDTVFDTVNISDEGELTYTIKLSAEVTMGTFMNIVFAVKPTP